MEMLREPTSERQFIMYEALRKGISVQTLYERTYIKPWFIQQMKELVELEEEVLTFKDKPLPDDVLKRAKQDGFSDKYLSQLVGVSESDIRQKRLSLGMKSPGAGTRQRVENAAYYFSTHNAPDKTTAAAAKGHGAGRRSQPHRPGAQGRLLRPCRLALRDRDTKPFGELQS
jgi:carbamoyl-phosphate synthase large subunit